MVTQVNIYQMDVGCGFRTKRNHDNLYIAVWKTQLTKGRTKEERKVKQGKDRILQSGAHREITAKST